MGSAEDPPSFLPSKGSAVSLEMEKANAGSRRERYLSDEALENYDEMSDN